MPWWQQPKVVVPMAVGIALAVALLGFADLGLLLRAVVLPTWAIASLCALMAAYLVVKGVLWWTLLRKAGVEAPVRSVAYAFLGGELTKSVPIGLYFQNYLLQRLTGSGAARGVATSTAMLGLEAFVTLAIMLALGVPGWGWLRVALVLMTGAWVVLLVALRRARLLGRLRASKWGAVAWIATLLDLAEEFVDGAAATFQPKVWAEVAVFSAGYVAIGAAQLHVLALATGVPLSFQGALAAYAFCLLVPILLPLPIPLGFSEVTGTGVLVAHGVPSGAAIALMFAARFWNNAPVVLFALPVMVGLGPERRRVLGR